MRRRQRGQTTLCRPGAAAQFRLRSIVNNAPRQKRLLKFQDIADESKTPNSPKAPVQRGDDPIDETKGVPFKFGLIKGAFVPRNNTADMHVENKTDATGFSLKDVYKAFDFVYRKKVKQKKISETEGKLLWNPQGAAVIKMVAELIGEALGNPELLEVARTLKQ